MRCDQCEALMINGIFCHETGCPNTNSRYDREAGMWVKQRECRECGFTVDADNPCCNYDDMGFGDDLTDDLVARIRLQDGSSPLYAVLGIACLAVIVGLMLLPLTSAVISRFSQLFPR